MSLKDNGSRLDTLREEREKFLEIIHSLDKKVARGEITKYQRQFTINSITHGSSEQLYLRNLEKNISEYEQISENERSKSPELRNIMIISVGILAIIIILLILIIPEVVKLNNQNVREFSVPINSTYFSDSPNVYILNITEDASITSLRLNGTYYGNVQVYMVVNDTGSRYLVFDSKKYANNIVSITGNSFIIKGNSNITGTSLHSVCDETCKIEILSRKIYLEINVEGDGFIWIKNVAYSQLHVNVPPVQIKNIEDILLNDTSKRISLNGYFTDQDNDALKYTLSNIPGVNISVNGDILTFHAPRNVQATYSGFLFINDGKENINSNVFRIVINTTNLQIIDDKNTSKEPENIYTPDGKQVVNDKNTDTKGTINKTSNSTGQTNLTVNATSNGPGDMPSIGGGWGNNNGTINNARINYAGYAFGIDSRLQKIWTTNPSSDQRIIIKYKDTNTKPSHEYINELRDKLSQQKISSPKDFDKTLLLAKKAELSGRIASLSGQPSIQTNSAQQIVDAEQSPTKITGNLISGNAVVDSARSSGNVIADISNESQNSPSDSSYDDMTLAELTQELDNVSNKIVITDLYESLKTAPDMDAIIFDNDTGIEVLDANLSDVKLLRLNSHIENIYLDGDIKTLIIDSMKLTRIPDAMLYDPALSEDSDVRICLLDTGINTQFIKNPSVGYNFVGNDSNFSDDNGHGTSVAYVIYSILPNAKLIVGKVLDSYGEGHESTLLEGLQYCKDQNASIISLSLGGDIYEGYCNTNPMSQSINVLFDQGILTVAATGNDGGYNEVRSPSCAEKSLRVAASTKQDTLWNQSNRNNATLLAAPGIRISTIDKDGNSVSASGTSMAVPFVSSVAAMLYKQQIELQQGQSSSVNLSVSSTSNDTNASNSNSSINDTQPDISNITDVDTSNPIVSDTNTVSSDVKDLLIHTGILLSDDLGSRSIARVDAFNAIVGNFTNNLTEGTVGSSINNNSNETLSGQAQISACQTISSSGLYNLTQSVLNSATCFTISANNVNLSCNGFYINYSNKSGTSGVYGVYVGAYTNVTIQNCRIQNNNRTAPDLDIDGIFLDGSDNCTLINNYVNASGSGGIFIYNGASYNLLINNTAITTNASQAIRFNAASNHNTLINNTAIGGINEGTAITFGSAFNTIINQKTSSNFTGDYHAALFFLSAGINNTIINLNATGGSGASGIYFYNSSNNTIVDCIGVSGTTYDVEIGNIANGISNGNILVNCSYNIAKESVTGANDVLIRKWNYNAYVNLTDTTPLQNANISAWNRTANRQFTNLTDATGWIVEQNLTEYINTGGNYQYFSNYTVNATYGGATITRLHNLTNDHNIQDNFTFNGSTPITSCPITLSTANKAYVLSNNITSTTTCITISANNVTVDCNGYNISYGTGGGSGISYGIYSNVHNTTIQNCRVLASKSYTGTGEGIYIDGSSGSIYGGLIQNTIINTWNSPGLYFYDASYYDVINVSAYSNQSYGIGFEYGAYNMIVNSSGITNTTDEFTSGLQVSSSTYCNVSNSIGISRTGIGIHVAAGHYSIFVNVSGNSTGSNSGGNGIGMFVEGSNYTTITNSTLQANQSGALRFDNGRWNNVSNTYAYSIYYRGLDLLNSSFTRVVNVTARSNTSYSLSVTRFYDGTGYSWNNTFINSTFRSEATDSVWISANCSNNTFIGNTFIIGDGVSNLLGFYDNTDTNNLFYWNNFTKTTGYYVYGLTSGTTNKFNTTIGGVGQGNIYFNISSINITDSNSDGWGDAGSKWPVNSTNWPIVWSGSGTDYRPAMGAIGGNTISACGSLSSANTVYTLSQNVSINGSSCFNINLSNVGIDCNGYTIKGNNTLNTFGIISNSSLTTITNCNIINFSTGILFNGSSDGTITGTNTSSATATDWSVNGYSTFLHNSYGINVVSSAGRGSNGAVGIFISGTYSSNITSSNFSSDSIDAIDIGGNSNNIIINNTDAISSTGIGLDIEQSVYKITFTNGQINGSGWNYATGGVLIFQSCYNNTIANSIISGMGSTYAIMITGPANTNNLFINNTIINAINLLYINSTSGNNTFCLNNFTNTSGYFVNDSNGTNDYNCTYGGITQSQGNMWPDVMNGSTAVTGFNASSIAGVYIGDSGAGIPYNMTKNAKFSCNITGCGDYAPLTLNSSAIPLTGFPITIIEPPTPTTGSTIPGPAIIAANISDSNATANTSSWLDIDRRLIGYWSMDSNSTTGMKDNSSWNGFATFQGGLSSSNITTGMRGKGLNFDGLNDYMNTSSNALKTANDFAISFWMKPKTMSVTGAGASYGQHIIWEGVNTENGWGGGDTSNEEFHISLGDYGVNAGTDYLDAFLGYVDDTAGNPIELAVPFNTVGSWSHVVAVFTNMNSAPKVELYLNGVSQGTETSTVSDTDRSNWNTNLRIGAGGITGSRQFNGTLDEVLIFNRSLSAAEVLALYDSDANIYNASISGLNAGFHNYTISAIDSAGANNKTAIRNFTITGTPITDCEGIYTIDSSGDYYLSNDLTSTGTCIEVSVSDVTVDCGNHWITYSTTCAIDGCYGFEVYNTIHNVTIKNCNILDGNSGDTHWRPAMDILSNNSRIINNYMHTYNVEGLWLEGHNHNITNNIVYNEHGEGFYMNTINSSITYNQGISLEGFGGIVLDGSSNCTLIGNNGTSSGYQGILLAGYSNNITMINNTGISYHGSGIALQQVFNSTLINNTAITTTTGGAFYSYESKGNTVTGLTALSTAADIAIKLQGTNSTTFRDCVNISGYDTDVWYDTSAGYENVNNTFINCSYNLSRESVGAGSSLIRKWYYQAYVNITTGSPVSGANITIVNRTGAVIFLGQTNSTGWIARQELVEYNNTGGTRIYPSNYTVNATSSIYANIANKTYNLTNQRNKVDDVFTFIGGGIPIITFHEPPTPATDSTVAISNQTISANVTHTSNTSSWIDFDNSLVGYWSMDYYNATGVFDNSSYHNFGRFQGRINSSNITTAVRGKGLNFNLNDSINVSDSSSLDITNDIAFSFWLNPVNITGRDSIITKMVTPNTDGYAFVIWDGLFNPTINTWDVAGVNVIAGWQHVVFTKNGTSAYIYVNGVQLMSRSDAPATINTNSAPLLIGDAFDFNLTGSLDEVMIFNRALGPQEILALYNSQANEFNATFTNLQNGQHNYSVYAVGTEGNRSDSGARDFIVNTLMVNPTVSIISPTTLSPITVASGQQISINFSMANGSNLTTGVSIGSVLIGGQAASIVTSSITNATTQDFEGTFLPTGWTTGYDSNAAGWNKNTTYKISGTASAASGIITDAAASHMSWMETNNITFQTGGYISFNWSVSSEPSWDYLCYCIDKHCGDTGCVCHDTTGTADAKICSATINVFLNGSQNLSVPAGKHYFTWCYATDSGTISSPPMGIVDNIVYTDGVQQNQFVYVPSVGWQVNVTVPVLSNGSKDLFINATYNGVTANDTEINAINFATPSNPLIITFQPPSPDNGSVTISNVTIIANISDSNATANTSSWLDIDRSLAGYWSFDYNSSTLIYDNSTWHNDGKFLGGLSTSNITAGVRGRGLKFDGVNDRINLSGASTGSGLPGFTEMSGMTISAWIKPNNANPSKYNIIMAHEDNSSEGSPYGYWHWIITSTGQLEFYRDANNINMRMTTTANAITSGQWQHVALTWNGTMNSPSTMIMYVNGANVSLVTDQYDNITENYMNNYYIGALGEGGNAYNGTMDEIMLFNRTLNASEIKALYRSNANNFNASFVALSQGQHNYTVSAVDTIGNRANSGSLNFVVGTEQGSCGTLNTAGMTYLLVADVTNASGTCFNINAANVTLDCQGHKITYYTKGSNRYGIFTNQFNTTIKNCTIYERNNTRAYNYSYGIYFSGATNSTVINTLVVVNNSAALQMDGSANYNRFVNNYFLSNLSQGIRIEGSSYNTFINNTGISGNNEGSTTSNGANFNTFINHTARSNETTWRGAIYIYNSGNNTYTNLNTTGFANAILLINASDNNFTDCINVNGTTLDVNLTSDGPSIDNNFVNCSYNIAKEKVTNAASYLTRKWYYQIYINQTNTSALAGANVTAVNRTGVVQFSALTDSTGWIIEQQLIDYINTGGTRYYSSNYTINASKATYNTAFDYYNATFQQNNVIDFLTLTGGPFNCGVLSTAGTTYNMTSDVNTAGTCFNVTAQNITLDCRGFAITYSTSGTAGTYGIYTNQYNTTIKNCTIIDGNIPDTDTTRYGIYFNASSWGTILNTTVYTNNSYAVYLSGSPNNTINNLDAMSNASYGICLNSSVSNNIINSTGLSYSGRGINLDSSNYTNITGTLGASNTGYGILLSDNSSYDIISGSNGSSTSSVGVYILQSFSNTLSSISGSSDSNSGILIETSLYNNVSNSNGTSNTGNGMTINPNSNYNNVTNSRGISNTQSGIYIQTSTNNNIISSYGLAASGTGIYLQTNATNNNIINSTGSGSASGIYITASADGNEIINSTGTSDNTYGIYLKSNSNNVTNSRGSSSSSYGIMLDSNANYNIILGFTATSNSSIATVIQSSSYNTLGNGNMSGKDPIYGAMALFASGYASQNNTIANSTINGIGGNRTVTLQSAASITANNTFINNIMMNSTTILFINVSAANNLFYWNNFTNGTYFINNTNSTNRFNTTNAALVPQGNKYFNLTSLRIYDNDSDGYGNLGPDYPLNNTWTKWVGSGNDWGPGIAIIEAAPVMQNSSILPSPAYTNASLLGYCNATNAQGTNVSYNYRWFLNGTLNATGTTVNYTQGVALNVANISVALLVIGQNWTLECSANDSLLTSSPMNSTITTIQAMPYVSCGNLAAANTVYNLTQNVTSNGTCFNVTAQNVTIDCKGYWINYSVAGTDGTVGIITNSYNTTIKNCNIIDGNWTTGLTTRHGIFFNGATNGTIINNNINTSNASAIYLFNVANYINITNNTATSATYMGIYILVSSYETLINNRGTSNKDSIGIFLSEGSNNCYLVSNNGTSNSGYGIDISSSSNNNLTGNIGTTTLDKGIYLNNAINNILINNTGIGLGNSWGIYLRNASNNTLTKNIGISAGNSNGIFVGVSSINNTFANNTINSTAGTSLLIDSTSGSNKFYWNNFTLSGSYYIDNSNNSNQFNTTSGTGVPQGNRYYNIGTLRIYDNDTDGFGNAGADYPLNMTTWAAKWNGNGTDWGPAVALPDVAPVILNASILPSPAYTTSPLQGYCNASDIDGNNVTYKWWWFMNNTLNTSGTTTSNYTQGVALNVANISASLLVVGQNWTLECQANDSMLTSGTINSTTILIMPTPNLTCSNLSTANMVYNLTSNVSSNGTCFNITADNITLDCKGYWINYSINGSANTYGIVTTRYNTTIRNCNIIDGNWTSANTNRYGINFNGADNSTLFNNYVKAINSYSIYLQNTANFNNITGNNVSNNKTDAIRLEGSSYITVAGNNITSGNNSIVLASISSSYFNNNNLNAYSYGFFIGASSYNNFTNNNVSAYNESGFYLYANSSNDVFTNNRAISNLSVAFILYNASNNIINNPYIVGYTDNGLDIYQTNNTIIRDCINISGPINDVYYGFDKVPSVNNTFINCSYNTDKETITSNASNQLIRKWYFDANVTNSSGIQLQNANVTLFNSSAGTVDSQLTDANGNINRLEVTEYINIGGVITYATPHTLNVTLTNFSTNMTTYNLSSQNNVFATIVMTFRPSCGMTLNANSVYTLTSNVSSNGTCFNITADNITLDCKGYWINYSTAGGAATMGIASKAFNTTIKNCKIIDGNTTSANSDRYGVLFDGNDYSKLFNNYVYTSNSDAIYFINSANYNNITNNTATSNSSYGIYTSASDYNIMTANIAISNTSEGIHLQSSSNNNLTGNIGTTDSGIGICIQALTNNILINNTGISSGTGVGISLNTVTSSVLTNNTGISNTSYGIYIAASSNNSIIRNLGTSNSSNGIYIHLSSNNTLSNNTISSTSGTALRITSSSGYNLIYWNNFTQFGTFAINNTNNTNSFNTTSGSGVPQGNRYINIGNYRIYDNDSDGFGNVGPDYPLNATTYANWTGNGTDWGPYTTITDAAPIMQNVSISPSPAFINASLTGYCNATDVDGNNLTYNYRWFMNGTLNATGTTTANYTPRTLANVANISAALLVIGQNWTLECSANDTKLSSGPMNSTTIRIQPLIPPIPILYLPYNGNATVFSRQPTFMWNTTSATYTSWYEINITNNNCAGYLFSNSTNMSTPTSNFTPSLAQELHTSDEKCGGSADTYYNWTVRACNNQTCSNWSTTWNFTIQPYLIIDLVNTTVTFPVGMTPGNKANTTDYVTIPPFQFVNNGNVYANMTNTTINQSLWINAPLGTQYLQMKVGNTTEANSFNMTTSAMNWMNASNTTNTSIYKFDYHDASDTAFMHLLIEIPSQEIGGNKTTFMMFNWIQS